MKKKLLITLAALVCSIACIFGLAACDNGNTTVRVTSVTLSDTEITLESGEETTLVATVFPDDATDKAVTWRTENSSIATVTESGKVTAVSAGTTTITATADYISAICTVTVKDKVPVQSIYLSSTPIVLLRGTDKTIDASINPENTTSDIIWTIEPQSVATIDNGKVTALSQGTAIVTATADGVSDSCTVIVTEDGFEYKLSEDGSSYSVEQNYSALVDLTDAEIASEFNGKPVTKIGRWAFIGLYDTVKRLKIPASVTEIDLNSINYCKELESIDVEENNPEFKTIEGILYNKAVTESIHVPYGMAGVVTIPESMTKITDFMFSNHNKLTGIKMHDNVTSIGKSAFDNCIGLHSITIPENMTEIGDYAFSGCTKLWEIFNLSNLKIELGGDVWTATYGQIGLYALNILYNKNDPSGIHITDDGYTFYTARENKAYLVEYAGEETELVLPNGYNGAAYEIHAYAFDGCDNLTSVIIPNNVTAIGISAFGHCENLAAVTISTSVTKLGDQAFIQSGITDITYNGTKAQWEAIEKGNSWDSYVGSYTIHCTDENIEKN